MKDPFAGLIVQNGSTNEGDIACRLKQVKKKLRKKIGSEYDDLPVKIVHSIFKQNFSVLADKYKVEIQLELMKKATAKPGFMRRLLNYFRKKKDTPGIAALNEELYQKVQEAIENWKSGNKRRLSSFFTPRKAVEPPKRDERDSKICYEEDWRKSIADESFFMNSALATSTPTTFGRHAIEKEASKIVGKLNDDPALMREVMNNLPEEAFTCRKNILEPSCSFDEN